MTRNSSSSSSSDSETDIKESVQPVYSKEELEKFKTETSFIVENHSKDIIKSLLLSNRKGCKAGNWPLKNVAHSSRDMDKIFALVKSVRLRKKSILDVLRQTKVSDNILRNTIKRTQLLLELSRKSQDQNVDLNSELE
jgi:hypothetical protein